MSIIKITDYKDYNIIRIEGCYCIYRNNDFQKEVQTFHDAITWIDNNN